MLQVNNLSKAYADRALFKDVSFNLTQNSRVGLIGRNGSGKSTLFKLILGEELPDQGKIILPKNYSIGALKQIIEFKHKNLIDECLSELPKEEQLKEYIAKKILSGLGFSEEDFIKDPLSFSGGFQLRISLAKTLIKSPNLLLLDEPTNYLDIVSLRWLKKFLKTYPGEIILITHDQSFMDEIITHTLGIHRQKLTLVNGTSKKYEKQIKTEEQLYLKNKENIDKKKKELNSFIERFGAKATKATQAKSKQKQIERLETLEDLESLEQLDFQFSYAPFKAKSLMQVQNLSFGYKQEPLFKDISFSLAPKECIGIIGKNGKGKSTLLNCLAGHLNAKGNIQFHPNAQVGHFGQTNIARLTPDATITQEILSANSELSQTKVRQIAGTMLFSGELADKKISVLSGGEKSRVMLGKIMACPSNILLLDEPTNHLDKESIESLKIALKNYEGASVIVTHSEDLLRSLVTKLIIFQKGRAELFLGSYDDFLRKIGWEDEGEAQSSQPKENLTKKERQKMRADVIKRRSKALGPLEQKITMLEDNIDRSETRINHINQELISASEQSEGNKVQELSKELSLLENQIEKDFYELESLEQQFQEKSTSFDEELSVIEKA